MGYFRRVVVVLRDVVSDDGGVSYLKSKVLAEELGLTSREVGSVLAELRDDGDAPITVEEWSRNAGSRVWRVELGDAGDVSRFLSDIRSAERSLA